MTYFFQDGGKHDFEENLTLDGSRFQVFGSGFFCFQPMDVHLASRQVDHTMKDAFCVFLAPPSPPQRKPQDHRWHRGSTTNLAGFSRRNYLKLHTDLSLVWMRQKISKNEIFTHGIPTKNNLKKCASHIVNLPVTVPASRLPQFCCSWVPGSLQILGLQKSPQDVGHVSDHLGVDHVTMLLRVWHCFKSTCTNRFGPFDTMWKTHGFWWVLFCFFPLLLRIDINTNHRLDGTKEPLHDLPHLAVPRGSRRATTHAQTCHEKHGILYMFSLRVAMVYQFGVKYKFYSFFF